MYLLSLSIFSSSFAAQFSEKVRNMSPDEIRIPPEPPGRCSSHLQVRWSLYSVWDVLDPVREILTTLVHCACFLIDASLSYQISCPLTIHVLMHIAQTNDKSGPKSILIRLVGCCAISRSHSFTHKAVLKTPAVNTFVRSFSNL